MSANASLSETHKNALVALLKDGTLFGELLPPSQRKLSDPALVSPDFGGEVRGFYPRIESRSERDARLKKNPGSKPPDPIKNSTWYPINSKFHRKAEKGHRRHSGTDIYAPYHPFPYEIPVLALADGELEHVYWHATANSIGHQANLYLKDNAFKGYTFRLIYAHLSRFNERNQLAEKRTEDGSYLVQKQVGRRISVKKGDVIGYIGISGNVDTKGEATLLDSPAGVGSGHLHLQLTRSNIGTIEEIQEDGTKKKKKRTIKHHIDLEEVLPFDLDQVDDVALKNPAIRPPSRDWKSFNSGNESYFSPYYEGTELKVATEAAAETRLMVPARKRDKKNARNLAPWPFHGLEFDNSRLLKQTRSAYATLASDKALGKQAYQDLVLKGQAKALAKTTPAQRKKRVGNTLDDQHARAGLAADPKQNADVDRACRLSTAILHLLEAQYALMGGPGFEYPLIEKGARVRPRPTCGCAVQGSLYGVARVVDSPPFASDPPSVAMGYLHEATYYTKNIVQTAFSVSFGSGDPRQITWSSGSVEAFRAEMEAATGDAKAQAKAKLAYSEAVISSFRKLRQIQVKCIKHRERLANTTDQAIWTAFCKAVSDVQVAQRSTANRYLLKSMSDATRGSMWLTIASGAEVVTSKALELSRLSSELEPAMPSLRLLYSMTEKLPPRGN